MIPKCPYCGTPASGAMCCPELAAEVARLEVVFWGTDEQRAAVPPYAIGYWLEPLDMPPPFTGKTPMMDLMELHAAANDVYREHLAADEPVVRGGQP